MERGRAGGDVGGCGGAADHCSKGIPRPEGGFAPRTLPRPPPPSPPYSL